MTYSVLVLRICKASIGTLPPLREAMMHGPKRSGESSPCRGCTTPMDLHEQCRRSIEVYQHNGRAFIGVCGLRGKFVLCGSLTLNRLGRSFVTIPWSITGVALEHSTPSITYHDPRANCCLDITPTDERLHMATGPTSQSIDLLLYSRSS